MTAQVQLSELPGRVITPQKVNLTEAPAKQRTANYTFQELQSAQQTPQQTSVSEAVSQRIPSTNVTALGAPQREVFRANLTAKDKFTTPIRKEAPKGAVPENIIGKSYNTFYGSFTNYNNCVGWLTVEKGQGDTVILKGFADGYDVKGVYNKTAGTVTCPASQVVGTHASLGTVTFYALRGGSYYKNEPVVLTFTDNNITFSAGVYCAVTNGGVVMMKDDLTAIESNGRLKLDRTNQAGAVSASFDLPLYISNVSDIHMDIQGLQSWLYGHNYKVPFTISGNKATLLTTDSLDWYNSTSGTQCYFMLGVNGTNITADPTFTVTKTDSLITLKADTRLFCGYNESGTSWRGYYLNNYVINNNVVAGGGGGGGEQPNPCAIAGKRYNTFFQSFTNQGKCVGYFTVEQGAAENEVILKGLADGYDVKGTWDATAKTVTCPANQVIGTHSTAGTITFYSLEGNSYSRTEPVVLTFNGNQVSFNTGIYAAVSQGGVAFMTGITGKEANGLLKLSQTNQAGAVQATHELPITVTTTSDNKIEVQGLQSWLYGHNYKVPFTISGNKATLLTTDSIDFYGGTNGNTDQCFFMLGFNGQNITPDPTFTIAKTDSLTTLTADTRLFCGYNESGNSWSGFFLKDYAFNYASNNQGGGGEMQDTVTVNNIEYALDHSKKEATVLGCAASLTKLDMPGTINANNTDYTVVAVAEQAFYGNSKLTSASLPKTLKVLGKDAFRNVRNLNELKIEDLAAWCNVWMANGNGNANPIYNVFNSIQSKWGKVYFNGTQVSTSLEIPASVNRIGRSFYGFKTLTSVTLPTGLKVLGDQSFANCINLPTVEIPSTVDSIGSAFWGCEKINNIVIPNGIVTLGASTFYGCKALTDVKLNEGLKTIGSMTFTSCTALTEIELPTTLTDIAGTAFMSSKNITSVKCKAVVPPTTTDNAFADFAATATLYVLEESIPAYKAALGWKNFSSIKKLDKSVNGIDADNDAPAYYYDLNGFRVEQENLTPGIYVKVQGSKTTKVVIK